MAENVSPFFAVPKPQSSCSWIALLEDCGHTVVETPQSTNCVVYYGAILKFEDCGSAVYCRASHDYGAIGALLYDPVFSFINLL